MTEVAAQARIRCLTETEVHPPVPMRPNKVLKPKILQKGAATSTRFVIQAHSIRRREMKKGSNPPPPKGAVKPPAPPAPPTPASETKRTSPIFFLYKEGVYGHGVWWIGEDKEEGRKQADRAATSDSDDYHSWNLYRITPDLYLDPPYSETELKHELVYTGKRVVTGPKTHEYRQNGEGGRAYARITSEDGEELWRTRRVGGIEFSCPAEQFEDMDDFIAYAKTQI